MEKKKFINELFYADYEKEVVRRILIFDNIIDINNCNFNFTDEGISRNTKDYKNFSDFLFFDESEAIKALNAIIKYKRVIKSMGV